jgi:hypothetical protein
VVAVNGDGCLTWLGVQAGVFGCRKLFIDVADLSPFMMDWFDRSARFASTMVREDRCKVGAGSNI